MTVRPGTETKVIIGIDIGTVNTSVTCLFDPSESDADVLAEKFDTGRIIEYHFDQYTYVRTELAWHSKHRRWIWGNEVERYVLSGKIYEEDRITLLKLGLDNHDNTERIRNSQYTQIKRLPQELGIESVEKLIVIFLELLWADVKKKLRKSYQCNHGVDICTAAAFETVVSVPAAWDLGLRHKMENIACLAGLPNVRTPVYEPDAAALFARYDEPRQLGNLQVSLSDPKAPFIILDGGGGSVDIVTFIVRDGSLIQSSSPDGCLQGSSLLNLYFYELFEKTILPKRAQIVQSWIDRDLRNRKISSNLTKEEYEDFRVKSEANLKAYVEKQFEEVKKSIDEDFDEDLEQVFQVEMSRLNITCPEVGLEPTYMEFPRKAIVQHVLSKMIVPVTELIHGQMDEFNEIYGQDGLRLKHLLFVGGASANGYIRRCIEREFETSLSVSTTTQDSATLIAKGAIIRSLRRDAIKSMVMSCSLGFVWDEEFSVQDHGKAEQPIKDLCDGSWVVKDRIHWVFRKRDIVKMGAHEFMNEAWHALPLRGEWTVRQYLYQSNTQTKDHLSVTDPKNDIHPIGYVDLVLSPGDRRTFPRKRKGTKRWHIFEYRMRITYYQTVMKYEFIIPRNGKAKTEADWHNDPICKAVSLELDAILDWKNQYSLGEPPLQNQLGISTANIAWTNEQQVDPDEARTFGDATGALGNNEHRVATSRKKTMKPTKSKRSGKSSSTQDRITTINLARRKLLDAKSSEAQLDVEVPEEDQGWSGEDVEDTTRFGKQPTTLMFLDPPEASTTRKATARTTPLAPVANMFHLRKRKRKSYTDIYDFESPDELLGNENEDEVEDDPAPELWYLR